MGRLIEAFAQFFDDAGDPLADGWLEFIESGTTSTQKATYSDEALSVANENPLQLDAAGRCSDVFGTGDYRIVSKSNNPVTGLPGSQIQLFDPVSATGGDLLASNNLSDVANAATARTNLGLGSAAVRAAEDTLTDGSNLPDGAAIKAYGDSYWGQAASSVLTSSPSDGDASYTESIYGINGGETISKWDLVYYDTVETEWMIADADAAGEAPAWGIALAATTDGNPVNIMTRGIARNDTWNWTPGAILYLSDTPGGLTETAPSSSGDTVQPVGRAITADIVYFNFNPITGFGVI